MKLKILFLISFFSLISGCTLVDAFLMKYDPNEYKLISEIRTLANFAKAQCENHQESKNNALLIANKTYSFVQFVQYIPRNDTVKKASVELDKIAQGLKDHYIKNEKVSVAFCKVKFNNIESSAEIMQQKIGDKPR